MKSTVVTGFLYPPLPRRPKPARGERLLDVQAVRKQFGGLVAVNDVGFGVDSGEIVALIGPNGAGKSTLFNLVTGVLPLSGGAVQWRGQSIGGKSSRAISRLGISRTFQGKEKGRLKTLSPGAGLLSALLGLGDAGRGLVNLGGQLLTMKFSRDDETEADIVGMDLAARAGYDPGAGVTLWQKMMGASKGKPPEFISTHPAGDTRIKDIQARLSRVRPLYDRAAKPPRRFGRPRRSGDFDSPCRLSSRPTE